MLALCLMLSETYYAQNHAGIIGLGLYVYTTNKNSERKQLQHNFDMSVYVKCENLEYSESI